MPTFCWGDWAAKRVISAKKEIWASTALWQLHFEISASSTSLSHCCISSYKGNSVQGSTHCFLFFSNSSIDPNICQNKSGCILGKSVYKWLRTQREYSQLIRWCGHKKKKKKKHGALGFDISLGVYFIQLRWRVETSWHRIYDAVGRAVLNIFLSLKLHIKENAAWGESWILTTMTFVPCLSSSLQS